ncbi:hypothetical protein JR316_0012859 [Psilocybe cubensis]|uniref:Uncharacterized protein n=1 Tax=Psilocybe cubensis TaxID=181762 RepID=A0ACB8GGT5_PSICU|nr:hypothetical protein JR316_0012859 [Psilocybe cubensis]KAH9474401.1 hypothetical protein JR316_0012859 [Psilocybe cubensis]
MRILAFNANNALNSDHIPISSSWRFPKYPTASPSAVEPTDNPKLHNPFLCNRIPASSPKSTFQPFQTVSLEFGSGNTLAKIPLAIHNGRSTSKNSGVQFVAAQKMDSLYRLQNMCPHTGSARMRVFRRLFPVVSHSSSRADCDGADGRGSHTIRRTLMAHLDRTPSRPSSSVRVFARRPQRHEQWSRWRNNAKQQRLSALVMSSLPRSASSTVFCTRPTNREARMVSGATMSKPTPHAMHTRTPHNTSLLMQQQRETMTRLHGNGVGVPGICPALSSPTWFCESKRA